MSQSSTTNAVRWERDDEGIVTLTMDDPGQSVNTMNHTWQAAFETAVDRLEAEVDDITGVVLTSAKTSFFAGGDLHLLASVTPAQAGEMTAQLDHVKSLLRRLERLGRPVVAAINGSALGGGLEIALACHHRVALDGPGVRIGLPETTLGLLPGCGGVTRLVRLLGLQPALLDWILPGTTYRPAQAHAKGVLGQLGSSPEELLAEGKAWIRANPDAQQPWDIKGFAIPGGAANHPKVATFLPAYAANLRKQVKGAPMPAPRAALASAVEGSLVDVDTATRIETRYLVSLLTGPVAKNMISAFFDLQKVNAGASRPAEPPPFTATRVGVVGGGMMGAGIAYVCAKSGIEVVLNDISLDVATRGKGYAEHREATAQERGRRTAEAAQAVLARITPTAELGDLAGADVVIEAVVESMPVKQQVFAQVEGVVGAETLLASNTSSLPITELAEGVHRSADVVGLHFFSPVDKMPLVEIVRGAKTSDAALAKAFDVVRQIGKVPIVVNDRRGFFTSRVIATFLDEGAAAVGEGVEPALVEQAALQAGYPTGPLQLIDEIKLPLLQSIREETRAALDADGGTRVAHGADAVIDTLIESNRPGRSGEAGFYDYDAGGRRTTLWPGLRDLYASGSANLSLTDLQERMLFAEALETVRCLDDGVLTSVADANIGSLQGIGFPPWTGGALQYINQYAGGPAGFVARARELAASYGPRFDPPASLLALAEEDGRYTSWA